MCQRPSQTWSFRDLSLGLETSRYWILKVSVSVSVLRPKVSVLVLKVLGRDLETSLWLLNKRKVLHFIFKFVAKCTKFPVPNNAPAVWVNIFAPSTSAPVERIFSHSALFMRPNRARMDDRLLSQLVFLLYISWCSSLLMTVLPQVSSEFMSIVYVYVCCLHVLTLTVCEDYGRRVICKVCVWQ